MNRLIAGAIAALAAAAAGSAVPAQAANPADTVKNPDQKVCEDITIVGSRLAVKRVCATRAQWAEKRRRDRELVDQAQKSPCVVTSSGTGSPSCGGM